MPNGWRSAAEDLWKLLATPQGFPPALAHMRRHLAGPSGRGEVKVAVRPRDLDVDVRRMLMRPRRKAKSGALSEGPGRGGGSLPDRSIEPRRHAGGARGGTALTVCRDGAS